MTTSANYLATLNRGTAGYYTAQNAGAFNQVAGSGSFAAFCAFILRGSYQQLTPPLAAAPPQWLWGNLDTVNSRGWGLSLANTSNGLGLIASVYGPTGVLTTAILAPVGNLFERLTMLGLWFDGTNVMLSVNGAIVATATQAVPGLRTSALPARLLADPVAAATSSEFVDVVSAGYTPVDLGGVVGTAGGTAGRLAGTSFKAFCEGLGGAAFLDQDAGVDWLHRYTPEAVAAGLSAATTKLSTGAFVTAPVAAPASLPDVGNGGPVSAGAGSAVALTRTGAPTISSRKNASVFFEAPSAAPGSTPTPPPGTVTVDLYVSPSLGNDANPGTQALPLATLGEAENRISATAPVVTNYNIHLRNETYPLPTNARSSWFRSRTFQGSVVTVFADEAWDATVFTIAIAQAAVAGTGAGVVVGAGLVVNAHRGSSIRMTSGPAAGQYRRINANTATDILVSAPFSPAPAAGNTFEIFTLNTTIAVPAATAPATSYTLAESVLASDGLISSGILPTVEGLQLRGLRITAVGSSYHIGGGPTYMFGVDQITSGSRKIGGTLWAGRSIASPLLVGWGVRCTTTALTLGSAAQFIGWYHGDTAFMTVNVGCFADVAGGFVQRILQTISGDARFGFAGSAVTPFLIEAGAGSVAIHIEGITARLTLANTNALGSGAGIIVRAGASLQMTPTLIGNSAAGLAVDCSGNSKVIAIGGAPNYGGAGNDWTVFGAAAFNKAALAALNAFVLGTDGSVATRGT